MPVPAPDSVSLPVPAFLVSPTVTNSTSPSPSLPPRANLSQLWEPASQQEEWTAGLVRVTVAVIIYLGYRWGSGLSVDWHVAMTGDQMLIHMALESGHMLIHMALESAHIH